MNNPNENNKSKMINVNVNKSNTSQKLATNVNKRSHLSLS